MEPITTIIAAGAVGFVFILYYSKKAALNQEMKVMSGLELSAAQSVLNAVHIKVLGEKLDLLLKERGIKYEYDPSNFKEVFNQKPFNQDCSSGCSSDGESKSL